MLKRIGEYKLPKAPDDVDLLPPYEEANGDKYYGTWKDNEKHGVGIYLMKNGTLYSGEWKNGKANGNGR